MEGAGKPPWYGASDVSDTLALSGDAAHIIGSIRIKSSYGGFAG
jgi:hypothetical protein